MKLGRVGGTRQPNAMQSYKAQGRQLFQAKSTRGLAEEPALSGLSDLGVAHTQDAPVTRSVVVNHGHNSNGDDSNSTAFLTALPNELSKSVEAAPPKNDEIRISSADFAIKDLASDDDQRSIEVKLDADQVNLMPVQQPKTDQKVVAKLIASAKQDQKTGFSKPRKSEDTLASEKQELHDIIKKTE